MHSKNYRLHAPLPLSLLVTAFLISRSLRGKHVTESVEKGITENDSDLTSPKLLKTSLSSNEKVVQHCNVLPFKHFEKTYRPFSLIQIK